MIEFINIQNFKTLLNASFPLGNLNLFSGLNGMGKSTLVQSLLLLRQSYERNTLKTKGLLLMVIMSISVRVKTRSLVLVNKKRLFLPLNGSRKNSQHGLSLIINMTQICCRCVNRVLRVIQNR